jgi:Peptidase A4 family
MKRVLYALAMVARSLSVAHGAAAASTVPKAYPGKNSLISFTRASTSHSPHFTGATRESDTPRVVLKGTHLMAGPIPAHPVSAGSAGYLDRAATGVRFTSIKTYFNVPSVSGSYGCDLPVAGYDVIQIVGIRGGNGDADAGVAETGCNGVTTADFFYNLYGSGAFYYSGVNPGDAIEASITVNRSTGQYHFQVNDLSTGRSLQVTIGCQSSSCLNNTALVLSQPGNLGGGVVPDFTMINFTGTTVDANFGTIKGTLAAKPGEWTSEALEETSPSVVKPSALQGGRAFSNMVRRCRS